MVKGWEDVQEEICRLYADGKPLKVVRGILQRERGFVASERAYRQKLKKWKAKRIDKERGHNIPSPPPEPNQGESATSCANSEIAIPRLDKLGTRRQQLPPEGGNSNIQRRQHRNMETALPRDDKFDNIIHEICEAPSSRLPEDLLCKEDIRSSGSTLPHYVAARGRLQTVLLEVMVASTYHGYSVDTPDEAGFTALHVAVQYDRIENVKLLLTAGAQFNTPNPYGELPLHTAIISSKEPGLVAELLFRHEDKMDVPIMGSSKRAGQTALDLVIERALREVTPPGNAVFTQSVDQILTTVLLRSTGVLNNPDFLQNHARTNHAMLSRAMNAIQRLWPLGAQRLVVTIRHELRSECRRRDWSCGCDARFDDLLSSAPQDPSSTISKPGPFMRF